MSCQWAVHSWIQTISVFLSLASVGAVSPLYKYILILEWKFLMCLAGNTLAVVMGMITLAWFSWDDSHSAKSSIPFIGSFVLLNLVGIAGSSLFLFDRVPEGVLIQLICPAGSIACSLLSILCMLISILALRARDRRRQRFNELNGIGITIVEADVKTDRNTETAPTERQQKQKPKKAVKKQATVKKTPPKKKPSVDKKTSISIESPRKPDEKKRVNELDDEYEDMTPADVSEEIPVKPTKKKPNDEKIGVFDKLFDKLAVINKEVDQTVYEECSEQEESVRKVAKRKKDADGLTEYTVDNQKADENQNRVKVSHEASKDKATNSVRKKASKTQQDDTSERPMNEDRNKKKKEGKNVKERKGSAEQQTQEQAEDGE